MIDLSGLASNLVYHDDGIWYARSQSAIDYPSEGNAFCYQVEEGSFWFRFRNHFILDQVRRFPPPGLFFDIGGGNGYVARALVDAGIACVLVEPGPEGITNARQRELPNLVCATVEDAGFMAGMLPAVGMFDVLEHIEDDIGFLKYINLLLQPGGRLYLTVPAYRLLWSAEDDFAQHYRRYTLGELKRKLGEAGYHEEFSSYIFAALPLPIFLFRTIPSLFRQRRLGDLDQIGKELNPDDTKLTRIFERLLERERTWLAHGRKLPFGGSCLVVACKP